MKTQMTRTAVLPRHYETGEMLMVIDDMRYDENLSFIGSHGGNSFNGNINFSGIGEYEAEDGDGIKLSGRRIA